MDIRTPKIKRKSRRRAGLPSAAVLKSAAALLLCLSLLACSGCANTPDRGEKTVRSFFAMDTLMEFTLYGTEENKSAFEDGAELAAAEIARLESEFSTELAAEITDSETGEKTTRPLNALERLNASGGEWVGVPEELIDQIEAAKTVSERSGGALDISIFPVVKAWGFSGKNYRVPLDLELSKLLKLVDYRKIQTDREKGLARLEEGMGVGLGAIAKGYASDRAREILAAAGVENAILSLGGNVWAMGERPEGGEWRIGIQDPSNVNDNALIIRVRDRAIITSGGYQRYFAMGDRIYHHIIDPSTGRPAQTQADGSRVLGGLASVTVVSDSGTEGDALSTALFVLGLDGALKYYDDYGGFEAVLITTDNRIICTPGLENAVQTVKKGYTLSFHGEGQ